MRAVVLFVCCLAATAHSLRGERELQSYQHGTAVSVSRTAEGSAFCTGCGVPWAVYIAPFMLMSVILVGCLGLVYTLYIKDGTKKGAANSSDGVQLQYYNNDNRLSVSASGFSDDSNHSHRQCE